MTELNLLEFNEQLAPSDLNVGDRFGNSVDLDGNYGIIGAFKDNSSIGSAYIFDAFTGEQRWKLIASDGISPDNFGQSVAIDDNIAIVGANRHNNQGSVYVYNLAQAPLGGTITQTRKLNGIGLRNGDGFGSSVALSGNYAVVGAFGDDTKASNSGAAYLFDVTTGTQLRKFTAYDGAANDLFGNAVAISGNYAVISSHLDDDLGTDSGSVYVYDVNSGNLLYKLHASDGEAGERFGQAIAVYGNYAVIGSPQDDDFGIGSGSVSVFDLTTGQEIYQLYASDASEYDIFGISVGVDNNQIVVGASGADGGGAVYVFDLATGQQYQKITSPDGSQKTFGTAVAVDQIVVLIADENNQNLAGSAYLYQELPSVGNTGENSAPIVANGISDQTFLKNNIFTFTFADNTFSDADGDTLTYSATLENGDALPSWLTFDANTRTFSGTPTDAHVGTITIKVTASDGTASISDSFNLKGNSAPIVANGISDQSFSENNIFTFTFADNTFSDADGDTLTYSATLENGNALPSWLTFDANTRTFSGTPTDAHVGTITVKVTASDGIQNVSDSFNLKINDVNAVSYSSFNGDGMPDAVWRNTANGSNLIWLLNPETDGATYLEQVTLPSANNVWEIADVVDFNQDGTTDILWRNYSSGDNGLWYFDGTTRTNIKLLEKVPDTKWRLVGTGDFNRDGQIDFAWRHKSNGSTAIWYMNGEVRKTSKLSNKETNQNWDIVGVGDLNKDGKADFLWQNNATGQVRAWYMDNNNVLSSQILTQWNRVDTNWKIRGLADFNQDGNLDVLWRNQSNGSLEAWYLNGSNILTQQTWQTIADPNWQIYI